MAFECYLILLLFFLPFIFQLPLYELTNAIAVEYEDPMLCTEASVDLNLTIFEIGGFPNVTVHTKMSLFRDSETQDFNIRISDFYGLDITDNLPLHNICYDNINRQCDFNLSIPFFDFDLNEFDPLISIEGGFIKESGPETDFYGAGFFGGYFLNGSLFPFYGTLYSLESPCKIFVGEHPGSDRYWLQNCCTKFLPAPKAPRAPACKVFRGTVTFYNGDNTVFAESLMYYFLNDGKIYTVGNYSNVNKYPYPTYFFNIVNSCGSNENPKLKCIIPLPSGDSSLFIAFSYTRSGYSLYSPLMAANVGTIIFRNKQTLMSEGVPFTLENACVSYNGHNIANKPSISKLCCTKFE